MGVATALERAQYTPCLERLGIYDLFSAFAEVGESRDKAFPDLYLLAAERMDVEPHCCVVFEDIVKGIRGAKGAGMKTVGVYDETSAYQWPLMCQMGGQMRALAGRIAIKCDEKEPKGSFFVCRENKKPKAR